MELFWPKQVERCPKVFLDNLKVLQNIVLNLQL